MKLLKLDLDIDSIIVGERVKGGIYRPCLETIPSSTVRGAFKHTLGLDIIGTGLFDPNTYEVREFIYSVKDKILGVAKMPFISSFLFPKDGNKIKARIYIVKNHSTDAIFNDLTLRLGALKNKGFGRAKVTNVTEIRSEIKQGILKVRIFEDEATTFGIKIISPLYGYLFYAKNAVYGLYKRALFEGSLVRAPEVFLKEATFYD